MEKYEKWKRILNIAGLVFMLFVEIKHLQKDLSKKEIGFGKN